MSEIAFKPRRIAEWDWLIPNSLKLPNLIHAPKRWRPDDEEAYDEDAVTECGLRAGMEIPGVLTRMGSPRCAACCHQTGMPTGVGSPKNDEACRRVVERRIAALA